MQFDIICAKGLVDVATITCAEYCEEAKTFPVFIETERYPGHEGQAPIAAININGNY